MYDVCMLQGLDMSFDEEDGDDAKVDDSESWFKYDV